jgi:hypothetical protein
MERNAEFSKTTAAIRIQGAVYFPLSLVSERFDKTHV